MSYIGKILVVMQLVLSICLMAFAAAVSTYQTNWKKKTEDTQKQLDTQRQEHAKLEQESKQAADKFNAALTAEENKSKDLAFKVNDLTTNVTTLKDLNKKLGEENAQRTQIGIDLADDSNSRQSEVKIVREKLKLALEDRDLQYKKNSALEDKIFEQNTKIDRLATQNRLLMVENKNFKDVLSAHNLPTELEEYQRAKVLPPKVEGKVLEARKAKEGGLMLLTISLGENDGLTMGNELTVYRGGANTKYLGRARVLAIQADTAVCELFQRSGLVEKGDDVSTKLN
jgi:hypothetical protein